MHEGSIPIRAKLPDNPMIVMTCSMEQYPYHLLKLKAIIQRHLPRICLIINIVIEEFHRRYRYMTVDANVCHIAISRFTEISEADEVLWRRIHIISTLNALLTA